MLMNITLLYMEDLNEFGASTADILSAVETMLSIELRKIDDKFKEQFMALVGPHCPITLPDRPAHLL